MGEARRRREARLDAYATGAMFQPDPKCPSCKSKRVHRIPVADQPEFVAQSFGCDIELCRNCRAIWEAFPVGGHIEDPVCAEPCDNCAFRPGSPEQADKTGWKKLIDGLKPDIDGIPQGHFYCHKGVEIDMTKGPGNFLFPETPVTADGEVVRTSDGKPVMAPDTARMRTCSGFLRMFWKQRAKQGAP